MRSSTSVVILMAIGATALLAQRSTQLTGRISDATDAVVDAAEEIVNSQQTVPQSIQ